MLYLPINSLIPSIACKSFGGTQGRALKKCMVYIFSDEPACRAGKAVFGEVLQAVRAAKCLGISVLFSIFFGHVLS